MNTTSKSRAGSVPERLCTLDRRFPLTRAGSMVGILAGALYTLQSAPHMFVQEPVDKLIVGAVLALLGGCLGWLTGALLRRPGATAAAEGSRDDPR